MTGQPCQGTAGCHPSVTQISNLPYCRTLFCRWPTTRSAATTTTDRAARHSRSRPLAGFLLLWLAVSSLSLLTTTPAQSALPSDLFRHGTNAYSAGDYVAASAAFQQAAAVHLASGTLQNLGNSEWQLGRTGWAILAWEQALWVDPLNGHARDNLRFARRAAQLESPELAWYEVVSSWLPTNCWCWIAGISLWLAAGLGLLPGLLHWQKVSWQQAAAAFVLVVFLLSLPALVGIETRSRIGFVLQKDTPLRLTPTTDAQFITRLAAGEPARLERAHGRFCLIRTSRTQGWVERAQLGLLCQLNGDGRAQPSPPSASYP